MHPALYCGSHQIGTMGITARYVQGAGPCTPKKQTVAPPSPNLRTFCGRNHPFQLHTLRANAPENRRAISYQQRRVPQERRTPSMSIELAIYPSLRGKRVIVTGGASGIGACLVENFAKQGARVGFLDCDEAKGRALAGRTGATFAHCDLRDIKHLRRVLAGFEEIAVLVNNAANDDRHSMASVEPDYWDDRMAINLRHQFFATQAVAEQMKQARAGSIINFGSVAWQRRLGGMTAYTTAKAAVHGMTRSLARELGGYGIRVNEVMPGWIFTERQESLWATPESIAETMKLQCIPERLYPEDVAWLVLWLAADDSRLVTAQSFYVDGGSV